MKNHHLVTVMGFKAHVEMLEFFLLVKHMCWPGEWKWGAVKRFFLPKAFWTSCCSPGSLGLSPDSSRSDAEKKLRNLSFDDKTWNNIWQRHRKQTRWQISNYTSYKGEQGSLPNVFFSSSSNFTNNISQRCLGQYF